MDFLQETYNSIKRVAEKRDSMLVAYSGGKDSMVVLDLCCRAFKRVECMFMYLVPGIEYCEKNLRWAIDRYGVTIRQYPHWGLIGALQNGTYCFPSSKDVELPNIKVSDMYRVAMHDAKIDMIAVGYKDADSMWRRRNMSEMIKRDEWLFTPIRRFTKFDVMAYAKAHSLPIPKDMSGATSSGVDFSEKSLMMIHDKYPDDWNRIKEYFPLIDAIPERIRIYGQPKAK